MPGWLTYSAGERRFRPRQRNLQPSPEQDFRLWPGNQRCRRNPGSWRPWWSARRWFSWRRLGWPRFGGWRRKSIQLRSREQPPLQPNLQRFWAQYFQHCQSRAPCWNSEFPLLWTVDRPGRTILFRLVEPAGGLAGDVLVLISNCHPSMKTGALVHRELLQRCGQASIRARGT